VGFWEAFGKLLCFYSFKKVREFRRKAVGRWIIKGE
jgi:hypothetical protein